MKSKPQLKNSKKAFSLPAAIIITSALIMLSASLIFIAVSSISNTSAGINSRQAYLNVKSALEYAASYYNEVDDITSIGTLVSSTSKDRVEYLIMKDSGGTVSEGAEVSNAEIDAQNKTTYVVANYIAASGSDTAKLRLTAYSNYADSFGNKPKTARLSVVYNIGGSIGNTNRITVISTAVDVGVRTWDTADREININVKQYPGQTWTPFYYMYTYKDVKNTYPDGSSQGYGIQYANADDSNDTEKGENEVKPAGPWGQGGGDKDGPQTYMGNIGNGWYSSTVNFSKDNLVNYFNLILAKKGAMLFGRNSDGSPNNDINLYNTQSCEMFHLWYLDDSDKNIYIELLQPDLKYVMDYDGNDGYHGWDGKNGLKDRLLVYVNNPMTTVHFKMKNIDGKIIDGDSITTSLTGSDVPKITSVSVGGAALSGKSYLNGGTKVSSNINMTYEGCGWWVAQVETGDTFRMEISYKGTSKSINVSPNSNDEAWVVADIANDKIQSRTSEKNANIAIGVDPESYVTVSAKAYGNTSSSITPTLSFCDKGANSSSGRRNLLEAINEALGIYKPDYTAESIVELTTKLNAAIDLYNDEDFINSQTDPSGATLSTAQKIAKADIEYKKYEDNLRVAMTLVGHTYKLSDGTIKDGTLEPRTTDENSEEVKKLKEQVQKAKDIIADYEANGTYDKNVYDSFNRVDLSGALISANFKESDAYTKAERLLNDIKNLTAIDARDAEIILSAAITKLEDAKLERTILDASITKAEDIIAQESRYDTNKINTLKTRKAEAESAKNEKFTTQTAINNAKANLDTAIAEAEATYTTPLDIAALQAKIAEGNALLNDTTEADYTGDSKTKLSEAVTTANTVLTATTSTQADIDNQTALLTDAIRYFRIYKPANTNAELQKNNKAIVWLDGFAEKTYTLNKHVKDTEGEEGIHTVQSENISKNEASGLYYIEIDTSVYDRVSFTIDSDVTLEDGSVVKAVSERFDVINDTAFAGNNIVLKLDSISDDGTIATVSKHNLTTVYIEKTTPENTTEKPKITLKDGTNTTELTAEADTTGKYFVVRFISVNNQKINMNTKADGSGTNIDEFGVQAGEWVAKYKTSTAVDVIDVDIIYPILNPTTGSAASYRISTTDYISTDLISQPLFDNVTGDAEIVNMATVTETKLLDEPAADEVIIWFKLSNSNKDKTFWLYTWTPNGAGNIEYTNKYPGTQMLKKNGYAYITVSKYAQNCIISYGSSSSSTTKIGDDRTWNSSASQYWEIDSKSSTGMIQKTSVPKDTALEIEPEETMIVTGVPMVFVGGNRVRIQNKSYYDTFNADKTDSGGKNLTSGNLFSNTWSDEGSWNLVIGKDEFGNDVTTIAKKFSYNNRVGDAELSTLRDWYEFKIPVDSMNEYTFEIKGLNPSATSIKTDQIHNAYGNVWVSMESDTKSKSKTTNTDIYADLAVYTFDPDTAQMTDTVDVYFKLPKKWTNPHITATGVGTVANSIDLVASAETSGSSEFSYYVASGISKNTPFLTFTVNEKVGVDTAGNAVFEVREYRTTLQGGDYILFDPEYNLGDGGWDEFVPVKQQLIRELYTLQGMYYGYVLINKYNSDGEIVDEGSNTYLYPEALDDKFTPYMSNGTIIESSLPSSIAGLTAKYNEIHNIVVAYKNLYSTMAAARAYIDDPYGDNSGKYPEYIHRGNTKIYDATCVSNLKSKLSTAESTYKSALLDVNAIDTQTNKLKTAIGNMEVSSEGSIAVVYYDTNSLVDNNCTFKIHYTVGTGTSASEKTKTVTDFNPEDLPIIFINETEITNVYFEIEGVSVDSSTGKYKINSSGSVTGTAKDKMTENQAWVYYDTYPTSDWFENSISDYKQVGVDKITQAEATDTYKYTMKFKDGSTTEREPMTLYFDQDTKVKYSGGEYAIKAGAYTFEWNDTSEAPKAPLASDGSVNLFSNEAKAYFENPVNYGAIADNAKTSEELGWTSSRKIVNAGYRLTNYAVNFIASSGALRDSYTSNNEIYFRWEGNSDLSITKNVTFAATKITIASSGTIDASTLMNRHFYIKSSNKTSTEQMEISFASDVKIKYLDKTGVVHQFTIREGDYTIKKDPANTGDYIADLFDETYWTSKVYVSAHNRYDSSSHGGSGSKLQDPVYSD